MKVTKFTNENFLCLTFENGWIHNALNYLHSDRETKEREAKIIWFGF